MAAPQQPSELVSLGSLLGKRAGADAATVVTGISMDSRTVVAGDLFLAIAGDVHDGRQFIEQAIARGAAAVVADAPVAGFVDDAPVPLVEVPELALEAGEIASRFYAEPTRQLSMVGVTGTNGKTTTSRLIAQLARALGSRCGVIGTLGASLDDTVVAATNTTPDAVSLQRQLARWRDQGVQMVAMEVSSHALVQGRVNGVAFDTAVFTNLSRDHLDYHGDMAAYRRAKTRLFQVPGLRHAVVNLDDPQGPAVLSVLAPDIRTVSYSAAGLAQADLRALDVDFRADGLSARIVGPWGEGQLNCSLPGDFNLSNLLAALAVLACAGQPWEQLLAAAPQLRGVPGRMELVAADADVQVIVDYAHTPDALERVLAALRPHVSGNLVTVFGCGGDRDPGKRPVMGRVASGFSDHVIITSDNPRTEQPAAILADIASGCSGSFELLEDRAEAIDLAIAAAHSGDCVVIAGKGHEDYQLIQDQRIAFSDVREARLALARRRGA